MTIDPNVRRTHMMRLPFLSLALAGGALGVPFQVQASETAPDTIEVSSSYTVDILSTLGGGARRDARLMGLLELGATWNGSAVGAGGLSLNLTVQAVHGGGFTDEVVGDVHGVSNIDASPGLRPLEAYAALRFGDEKQGAVKAGLIDLNADFDVQAVGAFFINSSFGIGPDFSQSGLNGPSIFPTTASAVTLEWTEGAVTARAGLFDGVAGDPNRPPRTVVRLPGDTGTLLVGEIDIALGADSNFQLGGWSYSRRFDAIDELEPDGNPRRIGGNRGLYGLIEGTLEQRGDDKLDAWIRLGTTNGQINPIQFYAGGGVTYGDDDNRTGIAIAYARLGDPSVRALSKTGILARRGETVVELTHSRQLLERLRVQPNFQYVINPGWNSDIGNALIAGVRLELTLF